MTTPTQTPEQRLAEAIQHLTYDAKVPLTTAICMAWARRALRAIRDNPDILREYGIGRWPTRSEVLNKQVWLGRNAFAFSEKDVEKMIAAGYAVEDQEEAVSTPMSDDRVRTRFMLGLDPYNREAPTTPDPDKAAVEALARVIGDSWERSRVANPEVIARAVLDYLREHPEAIGLPVITPYEIQTADSDNGPKGEGRQEWLNRISPALILPDPPPDAPEPLPEDLQGRLSALQEGLDTGDTSGKDLYDLVRAAYAAGRAQTSPSSAQEGRSDG